MIDLKINTVSVEVKTKSLKATWSREMANDIYYQKSFFDAEKELNSLLRKASRKISIDRILNLK